MKIKTFGYFFREALSSLRRNSWMVLASIGVSAVSLLIFGISLLSVANANYIAARLESEVEIAVFLKQEVTTMSAEIIKQKIESLPGVAPGGVTFISKEEALKQFKEKLGDTVEEVQGMNPLPHSFRVKAAASDRVAPLAEAISRLEGVEKTEYGKGYVESLFKVTKWARWLGVVMMSLLGAAAVFLIATTTRLTVFARRREIQIMKFLGATDWFIRWPFVMEGIVLGLFGAVLAAVVVYFSYISLIDFLKNQSSLVLFQLNSDPQFLAFLCLGLLGAGIMLGVIGSSISVRRFLRV